MLSSPLILKESLEMIRVGQFNRLVVIKEVPFGFYLDGGELGEILLPNKHRPKGLMVADEVEVFIYYDSEDMIIATTQRPRALMGSCACLTVVDVNRVGAFLDWGLDKDLLVPGPEQQRPMERGKSYIVYLKQDNKDRIIASTKLDHFLDKTPAAYQRGEEVSLMIADRSPLGIKVIINDKHWGLIHTDDIFQAPGYGKRMTGYIKTLREDGKIDIVLRKMGQGKIQDLAKTIMKELELAGGFLALHDKSSADEIAAVFNESKKSFKAAIGQLYKQGLISIEAGGIRVVS